MPKRRANHRLAKIHRSYSVEEIARLYGIHRNTVRQWLKSGLPTTDQKKPLLILGLDLAEFLQMRQARNRRTCGPGQMYCLRCREPKRPADNLAEFNRRAAAGEFAKEHVAPKRGGAK